ncbi:hypothetical protein HK100_011452, partial [Physocladia obscura]
MQESNGFDEMRGDSNLNSFAALKMLDYGNNTVGTEYAQTSTDITNDEINLDDYDRTQDIYENEKEFPKLAQSVLFESINNTSEKSPKSSPDFIENTQDAGIDFGFSSLSPPPPSQECSMHAKTISHLQDASEKNKTPLLSSKFSTIHKKRIATPNTPIPAISKQSQAKRTSNAPQTKDAKSSAGKKLDESLHSKTAATTIPTNSRARKAADSIASVDQEPIAAIDGGKLKRTSKLSNSEKLPVQTLVKTRAAKKAAEALLAAVRTSQRDEIIEYDNVETVAGVNEKLSAAVVVSVPQPEEQHDKISEIKKTMPGLATTTPKPKKRGRLAAKNAIEVEKSAISLVKTKTAVKLSEDLASVNLSRIIIATTEDEKTHAVSKENVLSAEKKKRNTLDFAATTGLNTRETFDSKTVDSPHQAMITPSRVNHAKAAPLHFAERRQSLMSATAVDSIFTTAPNVCYSRKAKKVFHEDAMKEIEVECNGKEGDVEVGDKTEDTGGDNMFVEENSILLGKPSGSREFAPELSTSVPQISKAKEIAVAVVATTTSAAKNKAKTTLTSNESDSMKSPTANRRKSTVDKRSSALPWLSKSKKLKDSNLMDKKKPNIVVDDEIPIGGEASTSRNFSKQLHSINSVVLQIRKEESANEVEDNADDNDEEILENMSHYTIEQSFYSRSLEKDGSGRQAKTGNYAKETFTQEIVST